MLMLCSYHAHATVTKAIVSPGWMNAFYFGADGVKTTAILHFVLAVLIREMIVQFII
jgi:hypothetical protein